MANQNVQGLDRNFNSIPATCRKCQGKFFVPKDSAATQKAVAENFGFPIPSECVPMSTGTTLCPYASSKR